MAVIPKWLMWNFCVKPLELKLKVNTSTNLWQSQRFVTFKIHSTGAKTPNYRNCVTTQILMNLSVCVQYHRTGRQTVPAGPCSVWGGTLFLYGWLLPGGTLKICDLTGQCEPGSSPAHKVWSSRWRWEVSAVRLAAGGGHTSIFTDQNADTLLIKHLLYKKCSSSVLH